MSSISSISSNSQVQNISSLAINKAGTDSDGDNDGSKPGEIESNSKPLPKQVSAAIGNNINTTA